MWWASDVLTGPAALLLAGRRASTAVAPTITNAGTITATNLGNPDGEVYSVTGFAYDGDVGTLTYQWLRDDVPIGGETNATYTSALEDDSAVTLKRETTVTNVAGSDEATTAGQLLSWAPQTWVENSGTAAMTRDGAFGANSVSYEAVFYIRAPAISGTRNWLGVRDARVQLLTGSSPNTGTLIVRLQDNTGTDLVDWASTAGISNSGDWIYHIAANLTGTPSFVVSRCQVVNNIPGAWETVAGSFTDGPTNGTINHARTGTGVDQAILASTGLVNLSNVETGYIWIGQATPVGRDMFATGGIVLDPALAGSPVGLFHGPAASFQTNHGSGGDFIVGTGTFTDT